MAVIELTPEMTENESRAAQNSNNGYLGEQAILDLVYPVGAIFTTVVNTNPGTYLGGTWTVFASGRTLVGVDTGQTEFNTVQKTGGHKNMQSHNHTGNANAVGDHTHLRGSLVGASGGQYSAQSGSTLSFGLGGETSVGGGHSHSLTINTAGTGNAENLQPYITVYFWRRTA